MTEGTLKINTEKLLPIIKKWLYSEKDIFLRELVSNSCDAISKLRILRDQGEAEFDDSEMTIKIQVDKKAKTLTISDTGIGMTSEEVEAYISQLAFSGAEEFLNKYQSESEQDQVIGHFGLGFYSAYMVCSKVEIETLSYKKNTEPTHWESDGTAHYTIEKGKKEEQGTAITLHIEDEEFLEEARLTEILRKYCSFLRYPIYIGEALINSDAPLYLKPPSECLDQEYLEFYRKLYPFEPDPIFWVHLNIDYPFHLKGILYFPKIDSRFDFQKSPIQLYCNRVFVSDNCRDLIPDYLSVMRGAIDSPDIPLNVSRSHLQMDKTVRSLSTHISKKVADRLGAIYQNKRETYIQHFQNVETILKLGIMQDEKFYERVKPLLIWENLDGEWTTVEEYLERHPEKIFYTQDHSSPYISLYKGKGIEVIKAQGPLDTPLMNFLELKLTPAKFQRIDGAIDPAIVDASREKSLLDADGRSQAAIIAQTVKDMLRIEGLEVEAKSLASDSLHALVTIDEQTRRLKETLTLSSKKMPKDFVQKYTFVVNTNSSLINTALKHKDLSLSKELLTHLYQLSLLSQKELPPEELSGFVERGHHLLGSLLDSGRSIDS
jgi:molecular chaperone HtpG